MSNYCITNILPTFLVKSYRWKDNLSKITELGSARTKIKNPGLCDMRTQAFKYFANSLVFTKTFPLVHISQSPLQAKMAIFEFLITKYEKWKICHFQVSNVKTTPRKSFQVFFPFSGFMNIGVHVLDFTKRNKI